jgi:meiotically up-regulated gene 157 (Mug157) protein
MADKDLARLFENAFPNTLDTTVRWHVDGTEGSGNKDTYQNRNGLGRWKGAQSFIVTGDINAEWLRDSTNQLAQYQILAKKDKSIANLILGAINTQAEFIIESPYCNAFQPPPPSGLFPIANGQGDTVHPAYQPSFVFECKYELDSLAAFLSLSNQYYAHTGSTAFLTSRWYLALSTILDILNEQAKPTFDDTGAYKKNEYTFQRHASTGTETLNLNGIGNPLAPGTGLIRSAFRPSDDATILGFLIPANAMMAVELRRASEMLKVATQEPRDAALLLDHSQRIAKGIWEHGVVDTPAWGPVFAYEVDGYGSRILMDDANLPSLLALPLLGFVGNDDQVYRNTRNMVLSRKGNPYFLSGKYFRGIGGPHIGLQHAWPMSLLVQAMTSDDEEEIRGCLDWVKNASTLGLINESVNVGFRRDVTRSWFAWANSVFAQTILDLAKRKPEVLFGKGAAAYDIEKA